MQLMRFIALLTLLALCWSCRPPDPRPSVILVVLDTLRRDFTGLDSEEIQSRTPQLDAFAENATTWENAYSTAPWTVPSHASMFTGLLPSQHGSTSLRPLFEPAAPALAELLRDANYRTEAFYSNPWLLDEVTGLLRGFQEHFVAADTGSDQGGRETLQNLASRLAKAERASEPFFFYVNFLESHAPYDPPQDIRAEFPPMDGRIDSEWILDVQADLIEPKNEQWESVRTLYGGDVRFTDRLFGEFVQLLEENNFFANGVLIVTSDHGESLGEEGYIEHQLHLDESLLAVPLAIRAPGKLRPGRRSDPALLTDLYATVLDLAELDTALPATSLSLLSSKRPPADRPLIGEYAGAPIPLLRHLQQRNPDFDVETGAQAYRSIRIGEERITTASDEPLADLPEGQEPEISEEIRQKLKDLGYLQ